MRELIVSAENVSARAWTQAEIGSLRVWNRWFDAAGQLMVTQDDGRAVIPQVVKPGERFEAHLTVTALAVSGSDQCPRSISCTRAWRGSSNGSTPSQSTVVVGAALPGVVAGLVLVPIQEFPIHIRCVGDSKASAVRRSLGARRVSDERHSAPGGR